MLKFSCDFEKSALKTQKDSKKTKTNKSENSAENALFTAILKEKESQISGFYNLPYESKALQDCKAYLNANKKMLKTLTHIVVIGIGGSSLGLRAMDTMLDSLKQRKKIKLLFLEHTDPIYTRMTLKNIKPKTTLFIAISKSGSTLETTSLLKYCLQKYAILESKSAKNRLLIITDSNSPLQIWAQQNGVQSVGIAQNVGGRFSVLSSVGLLPLSILGYKIDKILKGAREFSDSFLARKQEHILKKAIFLTKNFSQYPINVIFSYASEFRAFNAWYIQLWAESLGKVNRSGQNVGLTPISLIGSIDQHSFLQLILEGRRDKSVTFLHISESGESAQQKDLQIPNVSLDGLESTNFANDVSFLHLLNTQQQATMKVLQDSKIPTDSITLDALNERCAGALIMYYELLTAASGILLDINTYDQPAVEIGKKLMQKLLKK